MAAGLESDRPDPRLFKFLPAVGSEGNRGQAFFISQVANGSFLPSKTDGGWLANSVGLDDDFVAIYSRGSFDKFFITAGNHELR